MMSHRRDDETVVRLTLHQRLQHFVLILVMSCLALTGLALSFSETWLGALLISLEGGIEARGTIHRAAAIGLMTLAIWHAWYVVWTEEGHRELMAIKPGLRDVKNAVAAAGFALGLSRDAPEFGKYRPREKFQYWGVVAGTVIMTLSGSVLWFRALSMAVLPKWAIDLTVVIHGANGLLTFLVLVLWHLYNVHLAPGEFPNFTWITGRAPARAPSRKSRQRLGQTRVEGARE